MSNIKNFFKKIATLIKKKLTKISSFFDKTLNDGGKPSVFRSLMIIFVFSLIMTFFQFVVQNFNFMQFGGTIYINFMPIFLVCCIVYFTIGKLSWVFSICVTLLSILLTINHYKVRFRDEPLTTTDFSLGKEAGNIAQGYNFAPDWVVILIIVVFLLTILLALFKTRNKRPGLVASLIGSVLTISVSALLYATVYSNPKIYDSFYAEKNIFRKSEIVDAQGLVYSLLNDFNIVSYEIPDDYSENAVQEILNRYKADEAMENPPNIIAVMIEAYADIQEWENISFPNQNPYEYYNYLKTKGCYGKTFVPGFGGATAVTEFEFLTGCNTSAISNSMPTAYNTIINSEVFSIARIFKEMGYTTSAIHPGQSWFYNRQNVYPRMGFDTFKSINDLPKDVEKVQDFYVMDYVTADMIIEDYNNHLNTKPDNGYFNFTVTIQNHGQYSDKTLYYDNEFIPQGTAELTDSEYHIINNYLGGIYDANQFMKTIYEYINTIDKPTVFIIFGDHLPYLDTEEQIYAKLGLEIKESTFSSYTNRHSTDYLIIGNDAYMETHTPAINGHQEALISSDYLALKLFEYIGMPMHPFFKFKQDMRQYVPILSAAHNGTEAGFDETPTEELKSFYKELKILQYFNLRDYRTQ